MGSMARLEIPKDTCVPFGKRLHLVVASFAVDWIDQAGNCGNLILHHHVLELSHFNARFAGERQRTFRRLSKIDKSRFLFFSMANVWLWAFWSPA